MFTDFYVWYFNRYGHWPRRKFLNLLTTIELAAGAFAGGFIIFVTYLFFSNL